MAGQGEFPKSDGDILYGSEANIFYNIVPIGAILPWAKTITGVPTLPDQFVECSGQTLSDADSPLDGQVIPDLNGDNRFLRGSSTSGSTGGEDTHTLTVAEMPAHTHGTKLKTSTGGIGNVSALGANINETTVTTTSTGSGDAHNNIPAYYEVVYIMRVK